MNLDILLYATAGAVIGYVSYLWYQDEKALYQLRRIRRNMQLRNQILYDDHMGIDKINHLLNTMDKT